MNMNVRVVVDGNEIPINEFVNQMLSGMICGAIMTLKGVREDWKTIEISLEKE